MAQCKTIGKELIAGSVVICKKCKSHFDATINVKTHKPYTWCKDCRETLTKTTKRNKKSNSCEVASSISGDVDISDGDDITMSVCNEDDASDVCVTDNPNSITNKLNAILSKLDECPNEQNTNINDRLDKLERLMQKQYSMLKKLI